MADLDRGEAEAIVLAIEQYADLILVDERAGREVAARKGLRTVGLLGSLVLAKNRGLIPAVKPLVDELIQQAGFWVTDKLYMEILQSAEE